MQSSNTVNVAEYMNKRAEYKEMYDKLDYAIARARTAFKHAELTDLLSAANSIHSITQEMIAWEKRNIHREGN